MSIDDRPITPPSLLLWTCGLGVAAGLAWATSIGLFIVDVSVNDRLPDTAVTITASIAVTTSLAAITFGLVNWQRRLLVTAVNGARDEIQADTGEIPGLAELLRGAQIIVAPDWQAPAAAEQPESVPPVDVKDIAKRSFDTGRRIGRKEATES